MATLADWTITSFRSTHDELAGVLSGLSEDQLAQDSGASDWSVAQVLSHLGSGAEITLLTLRAALSGTPLEDTNQQVWDRWNAMAAREQADGFLARDEELVTALEGLSPDQRQALTVDMGFLPEPMPLAGFAGMRLSEAAQHSWDVRVAFAPAATLSDADVLGAQLSSDLSFLVGFIGKADSLSEPAVVAFEDSPLGLVITDTVSLVDTVPEESTATFHGKPEAALRLIAGRLPPQYTPADVTVSGNVTLDDLRRVFPGY